MNADNGPKDPWAQQSSEVANAELTAWEIAIAEEARKLFDLGHRVRIESTNETMDGYGNTTSYVTTATDEKKPRHP